MFTFFSSPSPQMQIERKLRRKLAEYFLRLSLPPQTPSSQPPHSVCCSCCIISLLMVWTFLSLSSCAQMYVVWECMRVIHVYNISLDGLHLTIFIYIYIYIGVSSLVTVPYVRVNVKDLYVNYMHFPSPSFFCLSILPNFTFHLL